MSGPNTVRHRHGQHRGRRGMPVVDTNDSIHVPVGKRDLGQAFQRAGEPIDGKNAVDAKEQLPIHRAPRG